MKIFIFLLICLVIHLNAEVISYWSFENNYSSSVGSNFDGTAYGDVNFTSEKSSLAPGTQAAQFSGSYVKMDDATNITGGLNAFTIEAFFNPGSASQQGTIYSEDSPTRSIYLGHFGTNSIRFFVASGTIQPLVSNVEVLDVTATINANTWYHVAAVFDGTQKTISVYLDGLLIGSRDVSIITAPETTVNPTIGAWSYNNSSYQFNGAIDEVRISDTALTAGEFLTVPIPEPSSFIMISLFAMLLVFIKLK